MTWFWWDLEFGDRSAGWRDRLEATRCRAYMSETALWQRSVEHGRGDLWYESTTPVSCLEIKSCTRSRSFNNKYPHPCRDLHRRFLAFPVANDILMVSVPMVESLTAEDMLWADTVPSLRPVRLLDSWSTLKLGLEQRWMPAIHKLRSD